MPLVENTQRRGLERVVTSSRQLTEKFFFHFFQTCKKLIHFRCLITQIFQHYSCKHTSTVRTLNCFSLQLRYHFTVGLEINHLQPHTTTATVAQPSIPNNGFYHTLKWVKHVAAFSHHRGKCFLRSPSLLHLTPLVRPIFGKN